MSIISVAKNLFLYIKNLLPYIKRGQLGSAFSLVLHQIDHHINIKVLKEREVVRKINGYPMILNFDEEGLSESLMIHRKREVAETETIKRIVKPGMCILEIGANVGYYTILMGKLVGENGKIYAYEPYPPSVEILIRNLRLNNLTGIVDVHHLAVSAENAVQKLYLGSATNIHTLMNCKTDDKEADYIEVETKDIREILVSADRRIDLVRMDIEGYERELLKRLSRDIEAFLPDRIFFEIHPLGNINPDPTFVEPLANILELGYYPELVISASAPIAEAKKGFDELNYQPFKVVNANTLKSYLYDNIKPSDLLKVVAKRPRRIARDVLLKRRK